MNTLRIALIIIIVSFGALMVSNVNKAISGLMEAKTAQLEAVYSFGR